MASGGAEANVGSSRRDLGRRSLRRVLEPGHEPRRRRHERAVDIFVHDRADRDDRAREPRGADGGTGQRALPSISADGRFVAFSSQARTSSRATRTAGPTSSCAIGRIGTTERVSVATSGTQGNGRQPDSFDLGRRPLRGLRERRHEPRRGRHERDLDVFVRDRRNGTTERATRGDGRGAGERRERSRPAISSRRPVRGVSRASPRTSSAVIPGEERSKSRIYVTDMQTGVTELLVPDSPEPGLRRPTASPSCRLLASVQPSISADGRFVAFASESNEVLPANLHRGWQVYVADRLSGLLRRISVGPNQGLGSNCAVEPAISGDGRVVAYRTTSNDLVVEDTNAAPDVLVSEWACQNVGTYAPPDALPGSCDPVPACRRNRPAAALPARRSSLEIEDSPAGERRPEPRGPPVDLARRASGAICAGRSHRRDRLRSLRLRGTGRGAPARGEARSGLRLEGGFHRLLVRRRSGGEPRDPPRGPTLWDSLARQRPGARASLPPARRARSAPRPPAFLGRRLLRGRLRFDGREPKRGRGAPRDAAGSPRPARRARTVKETEKRS